MGNAGFSDIILSHISRYPLAKIIDLYKLAHQAALGSEHALDNIDTAREWLTREIDEMGAAIEEPMLDPISADGQILRVHLHPYLTSGADPEILLNAFILTANNFPGSTGQLSRYWTITTTLAEEGSIKFLPDNLNTYFTRMKVMNYPPVHHSPQYLESYKPHYRVVARNYMPEDFPHQF
jgi:hypothetical protein